MNCTPSLLGIASAIRAISVELANLASEPPIEGYELHVIARRLTAQAEMLEMEAKND